MAIFGDARDFSRWLEGGARIEGARQRSFDAQRRKAGQDALDVGDDLLGLFQTLSAAVVEAQRAEHDRIVARYGDDHPRAREGSALLMQLEGMATLGERGRARATRALAALRAPGTAFHGFVTDSAGVPLPNLTVRLVGAEKGDLRGVTESDGYFQIPLPRARGATGRAKANSKPTGSGSVAPGAGESGTAQVAIVDGEGTVVYQDPVALALDEGPAYREYQLNAPRSGGPSMAGPTRARRRAKRPR